MTMASSVLAIKPTSFDIDIADDRAYVDLMLRHAFRDGSIWEIFLHEVRIDRTLELLRGTKSSMEQQLGAANREQKGGNPDWRKSTLNLLRLVNTFLVEAKTEVKRLDFEERADSAIGERDEWQRVCGLLVDLFVGDPALELVTIPTGGITAARWAKLRVEKVERKAMAA